MIIERETFLKSVRLAVEMEPTIITKIMEMCAEGMKKYEAAVSQKRKAESVRAVEYTVPFILACEPQKGCQSKALKWMSRRDWAIWSADVFVTLFHKGPYTSFSEQMKIFFVHFLRAYIEAGDLYGSDWEQRRGHTEYFDMIFKLGWKDETDKLMREVE